ncbi:uncharacterized protein [Rutidosis leptorrhynchoides]|uniref:uncharacterized protein n=1 Tax=Rutidosis leptorrhynchoides TaxID=125765 RepID=UPI003A9A3072
MTLTYLNSFDLFKDILQYIAPPCIFTVNGVQFHKRNYLTDGIYCEWATIVKSFKSSADPKTAKFKKFQESTRKDIKRAFGVLQDMTDVQCVNLKKITRQLVAYDEHLVKGLKYRFVRMQNSEMQVFIIFSDEC